MSVGTFCCRHRRTYQLVATATRLAKPRLSAATKTNDDAKSKNN